MTTQRNWARSLSVLLILFAVSFTAMAQQTVKAEDIMDAIKKGEDIAYKDVTVTGILDFTYMDEKLPDLPVRRRWWRNGGSNVVNELIESKITFENVTFEDDVIAYFHHDRSEYTFTADFEKSVQFKNCDFKRNAMFKYSVFERDANFSGTQFNDDNTFKYAEFEDSADFSNTYFDDDATFKYAKFRRGASFNAAKFDRSLDMKYTKIRGDIDLKDLDVRWDLNAKYAEVNGRDFTRYLLDR